MEDLKITLTYLNIRQSIIILLMKIISADFVLAALVIGCYWLLTIIENYADITFARTFIFLVILGTTGVIKIVLTIYVVLQWLNEYYEITPEYIYHKKGIIFRQEKQFRIDQIRRLDVRDSLIGEIFNFATISVFDQRLNRLLDMYLIHNPIRYIKILQQLKPTVEVEDEKTRLPFLPKNQLYTKFD